MSKSFANTGVGTYDQRYVNITGDTMTGPLVLIEPTTTADAIAAEYVQSRGMNLVTNGTALMQSNYNFSTLTYDASDTAGGSGMFRRTNSGTFLTDEFIPIDPNRTYKGSMSVKQLSDLGSSFNRFYGGVAFYDIDSNLILNPMVLRFGTSAQTTLAAPLKAGDTTLTANDLTGWYNSTTSAARNLILWPYYAAGGFQYDDYTYSRKVSYLSNTYSTLGAWSSGGISGNVITLRLPWGSSSDTSLMPQDNKTGTIEPTWPTGAGDFVYDNNIYWQEAGSPVGGETTWSASATVALNAYYIPTVGNGHRYQAVDVMVWPIGTPIQNTTNPGTYRYPFADGVTPVSNAWTQYTGTIGGFDTTATGNYTKFPYGTAFVKLVFLPNYTGSSANTQGISTIWFSELTAANIEDASATQAGKVNLLDQTLGDGDKNFNQNITVNRYSKATFGFMGNGANITGQYTEQMGGARRAETPYKTMSSVNPLNPQAGDIFIDIS